MAKPRTGSMIVGFTLLLAMGSIAQGELSQEEIARLGKDLTPLGAEQAGNDDGTIPSWGGGITSPPAGYEPGKRYVDPFADDVGLVSSGAILPFC